MLQLGTQGILQECLRLHCCRELLFALQAGPIGLELLHGLPHALLRLSDLLLYGLVLHEQSQT